MIKTAALLNFNRQYKTKWLESEVLL